MEPLIPEAPSDTQYYIDKDINIYTHQYTLYWTCQTSVKHTMYPYLMVLGIIQCFENHGYHPVRSQMHSEAGHGALSRQADYTAEN